MNINLNINIYLPGEGNGTPLQYSCLENPMDGGAWWAAVMGLLRVLISLFQQRLQFIDLLFLFLGDDVNRVEIVINVHPQIRPLLAAVLFRDFFRPLGQIAHVADACFNGVIFAQNLPDRSRLGR